MAEIFFNTAPRPKQRQAILDAALQAFPDEFSDLPAVRDYFLRIFVPQSRTWSYKANGKTGTSSTKRFLFELEFGIPLTARFASATDINPDATSHRLTEAGLFQPLIAFPRGHRLLPDTLQLTTVRNPERRALSAFLYLCVSHDRNHPWFVDERLRMNAMVRFDWNNDIRTAAGFEKFLDYVAQTIEQAGPDSVDPHWRPLVPSIKPNVFQADLIGRTEDLGTFYKSVAERLDRKLPDNWSVPHANKNSGEFEGETLLTSSVKSRIEQIYRADFEAFGY
ncbi:sulfotransferase family 2 domain-containing protein [Leisingera sp. ANG-M7]|uniref:sulfotransferase family 2 domain-containing protein n=1 Tax=Leisingera sp. ANG-M7 TaxID=1577902 RepID=UPI00057E3C0D|nr:sulfotransferase family 2 domain-containing protein [Leisingera sp. ANG-M7]KIC38002.1 hypothetical protein RA26_07005 [Leisingera sp. ANG-M7]